MKSHTSCLCSFWGSVGIQCPCLQIWRLSTNRYFVFSTASFVSFDIRADALTSIGGRMHHSCSQYTSSHPTRILSILVLFLLFDTPLSTTLICQIVHIRLAIQSIFRAHWVFFLCKYTPLYIYCVDKQLISFVCPIFTPWNAMDSSTTFVG